MKVVLTDCRASWGQEWNQSIAVQFTRAGNFRARVRNVNPTGEKHKTTWRTRRVVVDIFYRRRCQTWKFKMFFFQTLSCLRILSMKKLQQLSLLSMSPNPLSSIRIDVTIISTSSSLKRSGISPKLHKWCEDKTGILWRYKKTEKYLVLEQCIQTWCQHIVDEHQEAFIRNLSVCMKEHRPNVLHPHLYIQRCYITLGSRDEQKNGKNTSLELC